MLYSSNRKKKLAKKSTSRNSCFLSPPNSPLTIFFISLFFTVTVLAFAYSGGLIIHFIIQLKKSSTSQRIVGLYFFCCLISEREPSVSGVARSTLATQGDSVDTEEDAETDDTGSTSGKAPSPSNPLLQERSNCEELRHVVCHLETKELWDKFNELGTEMIITKTGRWALKINPCN